MKNLKQLGEKAMKLFFRITIVFTILNTAQASLIRIHHANKQTTANHIKKYFISKYEIPQELIEVTHNKCPKKMNRKLELCINKDSKLKVIGNHDKVKIITSSLSKFSSTTGVK